MLLQSPGCSPNLWLQFVHGFDVFEPVFLIGPILEWFISLAIYIRYNLTWIMHVPNAKIFFLVCVCERGMHQNGVYNNCRMCKSPNDVLYSSPLHQTSGYHINYLLVVFNSTSRISSAWIILIKVMLKQKNANGDCHVFTIIFNTLLLQTFGTYHSKKSYLTLKEDDDVPTQLFY